MHTQADIDKLFAGTMLQRKLLKGQESKDGYVQQTCFYYIRPKPLHPGAGELIGGVSLAQRGDNFPPDNGWALLEAYSGHGYATEAAAELLRYVREDLGIKEVIAWPNPANIGSVKVAERIGMVKSGEVKDKATGQIKVVYALEGMDWPKEDGLEIGHTR